MLTINGSWTPESTGNILITGPETLEAFVEQRGFAPYFKCRIPGISVEEFAPQEGWWSGDVSCDPWEWRAIVAERGRVAYSKVFEGKAGFISREWYPLFAALRRSGYDFDSRWDDGLAKRREKLIMDVLEGGETTPSFELKRLAGFGAGGEKGFDGTLTRLMMQTYVTIRGFKRRINARGEEYGWAVAVYSTAEALFGKELVTSAYDREEEAFDLLAARLAELCPQAGERDIKKLLA